MPWSTTAATTSGNAHEATCCRSATSTSCSRAPEVADIALQNKALVYDLLFKAVSETMLTIAADPNT
jgi:hypothetical protein